MSTMTEQRFKVGDRVQADHPYEFGTYKGTVTEVDTDENGEVRYLVRKVDHRDPEFESFTESRLQRDEYPATLDTDDLGSLRRELVDSATRDKPEIEQHTGIFAESRGERIRSASRIAHLATRIAWLEASAQMKADREL